MGIPRQQSRVGPAEQSKQQFQFLSHSMLPLELCQPLELSWIPSYICRRRFSFVIDEVLMDLVREGHP